MIRHTLTFTGRVQGVGFRATAESIAQRFAISGFVRNQRDGSVLCVAEGDKAEIDRFVSAVQHAMSAYVCQTHVAASPATSEFTGFTVRP